MFTGIIEEVGKIRQILISQTGKITIAAKKIIEKLSIGDSVACNGTCLTVTAKAQNSFQADISRETIERTTFKYLKTGAYINLETPLTVQKFINGHIISGHIDTVGQITGINSSQMRDFREMTFSFQDDCNHLIIDKGSVSIDGISLTTIVSKMNTFSIAVIPQTLKDTNLGFKKKGDYVNLEFDIIGKYVEQIHDYKTTENNKSIGNKTSPLSIDFLKKAGF